MSSDTLDINETTLKLRQEALQLTARDRELLADVRHRVEPYWDSFIKSFYARLKSQPETAALLRNPDRVDRLMRAQRQYLERLFGAPYDLRHAESLVRMGLRHYEIHLTPQWYIASCAHILCDHAEVIFSLDSSQQERLRLFVALIRSVFYDISFVLDAYGAAEISALHQRRIEYVPSASDQPESAPDVEFRNDPGATDRASVTRLRLTADEVDQRKAFVGIDERELRALRASASSIAARTPRVLDDFYDYFSNHPETAALVPEHVAARLKQQVGCYWQELVNSDFGRPYAASRMRLGVVHERIGLSLQWYLGGLARQLACYLSPGTEDLPDPLAVQALTRAAFFDLTYVIDAYMEARAHALLSSTSFAHDLMVGMASAVVVLGQDERVISANPALLKLLPTSPSLLYHMPIRAALPLPEVNTVMQRLAAEPGSRAVALGKFGNRTLRISAMRLGKHSDIPGVRTALILDDVSELGKVVTELRSSELDLSRIIGSVDVVVWEMDLSNYTLLSVSTPVQALTGLRDVHFIGRKNAWLDVVLPEDRQRLIRCLHSCMAESNRTIEYRIRHTDGTDKWVESHLRRVGRADRSDSCHSVTIDVTARKRAERLRLDTVGRMAGAIGHILNNSLMAISGAIQLQAGRQGGLSQVPLLNSALQEAADAAGVTSQLLAFAGRQALRPERLDRQRMVDAINAAVQHSGFSPITISRSDDADLWPVKLDEKRLSEAILALVQNSEEAGDGSIRIAIQTRNVPSSDLHGHELGSGSDWVEISVSDSGPGMDAKTRERAMEPFFTTKSEADGHYGLGLSMVYGFAVQSGGYVSLESIESQGTTIRMRFPRLVEVASGVPHSGTETLNLLLVEDSELVLEVVRDMLSRQGYKVTTASLATEAVAQLRWHRFDILVTDIVLGPGPSGLDIARIAVKANPGIGVLVMSGYAADHLDLSAMPSNFRFLQKPFTEMDLANLMKEITDSLERSQRIT